MRCSYRFPLLFVCVGLLNAAIVQGPHIDAVTYSSARVTWLTDVASTTIIQYGPTNAYGKVTAGVPSTTTHSWYISGLAPSTTYHYRVCSGVGTGTETCSENMTFQTAAKPANALPQPPQQTVNSSMPAGSWGAPFRIASDCSNLPTVLATVANLTGSLNHAIEIPPGTECRGQFVFPRRPNHTGWIVVQSLVAASAFPEGVRVTEAATAQMATFRTDALPATRLHSAYLPASCAADTLFSAYNFPEMAVLVCRSQPAASGAKAVSAITTGVGGAVVKVAAHGYTNGDVVKIAGSNAGVDGTFRIKVTGADTFLAEGAPAPKPYSAGATATRHPYWRVVPHSSGTTLPTSCQVNAWFYKTDKPAAEAAYWCTSAGVWTNVRQIFTTDASTYSALQFADGAARYRFVGIEVTHNPVPNPPPAGWSLKDYKQAVVGSLVTTKETNSHIVFDRCDIHGLDYPARLAIGIQLDGAHVGLIHSRVHKINRWVTGKDGVNMEAFAINVGSGPGPGKIENNYLEAIGITLFFPDAGSDAYHRTPQADYEIRRNYFAHPDKYLYGSTSNVSGKNYTNRHHFEVKRGRRMVIEGNIFDTNWADVNQGAFIMLSPRPGAVPAAKTITNISYGQVTVSSGTAPYKAGMLVSLKGTGAANHDGIWRVATVPNATTFTIANPPSGSGTTGTSVAVASDIQVSDLDFRNNIFRYGPNVLWMLGHEDGTSSSLNTKVTQRIAFRNNLTHGINALSSSAGGWTSPLTTYAANGRPGIVVYAARGVEDLTIQNNTVHDVNGTSPTFLFFDAINAGPNAGLVVENNIFSTSVKHNVAQINGTYFGTNAFNAGWTAYANAAWRVQKNVFCCAATAATQAANPPMNSWAANASLLQFRSEGMRDYSLLPTSPYAAGKQCFNTPGDCTTNGQAAGVDFPVLQSVLTPDERP